MKTWIPLVPRGKPQSVHETNPSKMPVKAVCLLYFLVWMRFCLCSKVVRGILYFSETFLAETPFSGPFPSFHLSTQHSAVHQYVFVIASAWFGSWSTSLWDRWPNLPPKMNILNKVKIFPKLSLTFILMTSHCNNKIIIT